jgi:phosphate transport system substrate-binding protein
MLERWTLLKSAVLAAIAAILAGNAYADVRVQGSTTVAYGLMNPQKINIEKLAGVGITILPSSTAHGMTALAAGNADIAMLAEPLASIAAAMNSKQADSIDPAIYEDRHVGNAYVQIIVHPSNPVQMLPSAELARLFSGQVKNWQEIGGPDQPVLLIGEPTSTPHRLIQEALRITYSPELKAVQNTNQTATIVAQAPGAISYITTAHDLAIRDKLKVVQTDLNLPLGLHLTCRKDASPDVKRVIDAAARVGQN